LTGEELKGRSNRGRTKNQREKGEKAATRNGRIRSPAGKERIREVKGLYVRRQEMGKSYQPITRVKKFLSVRKRKIRGVGTMREKITHETHQKKKKKLRNGMGGYKQA